MVSDGRDVSTPMCQHGDVFDLDAFSNAECDILEALYEEGTLCTSDLVDLTGKSRNNITKIIHGINGKIPGLVHSETGDRVGGVGRPFNKRMLHPDYVSGVGQAFAARGGAEAARDLTVTDFPALAYALKLAAQLEGGSGSPYERLYLCDRIRGLLTEADTNAEQLAEEGAALDSGFASGREQAMSILDRALSEIAAEVRDDQKVIADVVDHLDTADARKIVRDLAHRTVAAFDGSGGLKLKEFATALIGCAESSAFGKEKEAIQRAWGDYVFQRNVGLTVQATVRSAAAAAMAQAGEDSAFGLSKRLLTGLGRLTLPADQGFAGMIGAAARAPNLEVDERNHIVDVATSFTPAGTRPGGNGLLPAEMLGGLREKGQPEQMRAVG